PRVNHLPEDVSVGGEQDPHVEPKRVQGRRQGGADVAEAAGLGERLALRGDEQEAGKSGRGEVHKKKTPVGGPGSYAYIRTKGGMSVCKGGKSLGVRLQPVLPNRRAKRND